VDYPVTPNRWRTRALLFALVAALELVVLVAVGAWTAGGALVGGVETAARSHELAPVRKRVVPTAKVRPVLAPSETSVLVLNGNGVAGAAAATAAKVRSHEYVVSGAGNATQHFAKSIVMYRAGFDREAKALGKAMGVALVGPLDGMHERDLMGAHVALVVGG